MGEKKSRGEREARERERAQHKESGRERECEHRNGRQAYCCLITENPSQAPPNIDTEPHKYFDQVVIVVRSGDGGQGVVLTMPSPATETKQKRGSKSEASATVSKRNRKKGPLKRGPDGSLLLPMGGQGGDVVIVADDGTDSLLDFHRKRRYTAKRGSNVDAMGSLLSAHLQDGVSAPSLRVHVPVGTVVKRKRGGKFLADLASPGDEVLVARGGRGGISIVEIPKTNRRHLRPINAPVMTEESDKALIKGMPGEEVTLELTLRVVADVGLVGLPNAGKSSLLAAVSLAKPEIADYPFTTLMPNLGQIGGDPGGLDGGFALGPTVADLPGLIKGAHLGKGLGRMFLRHLRRTKLLVHVVDAATEDPVQDYNILREELQMYNPEYLIWPHIVVLNKLDLPEAQLKFPLIKEQLLRQPIPSHLFSDNARKNGVHAGVDHDELTSFKLQGNKSMLQNLEEDCEGLSGIAENSANSYPAPIAVVGISALRGLGVLELLMETRVALQKLGPQSQTSKHNRNPKPESFKVPQWRL
ncbi:hypothetical protein O6H91_11G043600 [Diphasiastrum complanatum]|uniref:Uncharacterized protein n=1 Tax=Diphasiastrum complanatum TaxID=34168 RepID=A0ACC2C8K0_DIPCM|nr:hypothetical protein O6H91_11G043600 [Diphasiastrum complanatum]